MQYTQPTMGKCDVWHMDLLRMFWKTQRPWGSSQVSIHIENLTFVNATLYVTVKHLQNLHLLRNLQSVPQLAMTVTSPCKTDK